MPSRAEQPPPVFISGRLWLDFINTDDLRLGVRVDSIATFEDFVAWLEAAQVIDRERAALLRRRATEQPSGATAALVETRRVRAMLRQLAEQGRGERGAQVRAQTVEEINRILGRSVGTRRLEPTNADSYVRSFVPVGDAFGGLVIPIIESAVDSLVRGELPRIRNCSGRRCPRYFADDTKSKTRRWCDMKTCGNRAKAARSRAAGRKTKDGRN